MASALDTRPSNITTRFLTLTLICRRWSSKLRSARTRLLKSLARRRSLTRAQSCAPGVRDFGAQAIRPATNSSASDSDRTVLCGVARFNILVLLSFEISNHRKQAAPGLLAEVNRSSVGRPRQAGKVEIRVAIGRQLSGRAAGGGHHPQIVFVIATGCEGDTLFVRRQANVVRIDGFQVGNQTWGTGLSRDAHQADRLWRAAAALAFERYQKQFFIARRPAEQAQGSV